MSIVIPNAHYEQDVTIALESSFTVVITQRDKVIRMKSRCGSSHGVRAGRHDRRTETRNRRTIMSYRLPGERMAAFLMGATENYRTEDGRKIYLFYTFNGAAMANQYGIDIEGNEVFGDRRVWFNELKQADTYIFSLEKDRHRHRPARARADDQKRGRAMKRPRTYRYIPQRTIKTYDLIGWRVNLVRCQHEEGAEPRYEVSVWDDYAVARLAEAVSLGVAEEVFDKAVDAVQLEVAKHALGIGRKRYESVA